MEQLLKKSLKLGSSVTQRNLCGRVEEIQIICEEKTYNSHNGITIFCYKGNVYLTPFGNAEKILKQLGFKKDPVYVPFSNCNGPASTHLNYKWNVLKNIARHY